MTLWLSGLAFTAAIFCVGAAVGKDGLPAELPFEIADTNRVVVDLASEGAAHRLPLLVDTGASESVLPPGLARRLAVSVRAVKRSPYRRATRLGRDLSFFVDPSARGTPASEPYGLLGGSFLAHYVLELDFGRRRVRFLDPTHAGASGTPKTPGSASLPLRVISDRPHAEIEVNGEVVRVLVDTGDPFGLSLPREKALALGIRPVPVEGLVVAGPLGSARAALGEARELRLGACTLAEFPVLVPEGRDNQGDPSGASLGVDLLSLFDVRVDYAARRLELRRREVPPTFYGADWSRLRRTGVHLELVPEEDGAAYVRYVLPESPAWQLGLRPADWVSPLWLAEQGLDLDGLHRRIEAGGPLSAVRETDGRWIEVDLRAEP